MTPTFWRVARYVIAAAFAGLTTAQLAYHYEWITIALAVLGVLSTTTVPVSPRVYSVITSEPAPAGKTEARR